MQPVAVEPIMADVRSSGVCAGWRFRACGPWRLCRRSGAPAMFSRKALRVPLAAIANGTSGALVGRRAGRNDRGDGAWCERVEEDPT
ncbi:MAG: hypothetical protein D6725_09580 [Planctomycetota bacterium]|nr:MAG: hypothetical protein D6725_09580 [Planctomycetota bacterium]